MSKKTKLIFLLLLSALLITGCAKRNPGTDVKINYPESIVSLSPAASEILFAIGAGPQVAAVSDFTDYPAEAAALPKVGGFDGKTLSMEVILSYKPDFVYLTDGMHNFLIEQLESNKIPYYLSKADSIESVKREILIIGNLTGHSAEAQKVVVAMNEKLGKFESVKLNKARKPEVYYEVWNAPYMSAGNKSFINDVITSAGGVNLFGDVEEAYPIVSEESIIARDPKVILLPASSGVTADSIKARDGWKDITAVQFDQVFIVDDNVFTRPGPRIADCVENLYHLLGNE